MDRMIIGLVAALVIVASLALATPTREPAAPSRVSIDRERADWLRRVDTCRCTDRPAEPLPRRGN